MEFTMEILTAPTLCQITNSEKIIFDIIDHLTITYENLWHSDPNSLNKLIIK